MNDTAANPQRGYSAFISHASADHAAAETIVASLEEKGLSCWVAPRDIRPGAEYADEILRGIEQSKCFVLVLSDAANLSAHVRREVERAASKGKPIYPVRIKNVPPSPKLEYFISMHHWLDAWEGILGDHAARLAAAIESHEEWIGNRVLARRQRRTIGLAAAAAAMVIAIVAGFVFSPDIRGLLASERDRAISALAARGIPVSQAGAAQSLAAASVDDLKLLGAAGLTPQQLNAAFAQSASDFFTKSRDVPAAIEWLKEELAGPLDPNLLMPSDIYDQEAVIAAAVRAGNADAAIALLDAGASPHPYQNVWFSPFSLPRFLFPYTYVLESEVLERDDKARLLRAFAEAGALAVPINMNDRLAQEQDGEVARVLESSAELGGFAVPASPGTCQGHGPTPLCRTLSQRSGKDWCAFMADLPVRILWQPGHMIHNLGRIDVGQLLTVIDNKAYVLGIDTLWGEPYLIIEISADARTWNIYKFTPSAAGMGLCKAIDESGYQPDDCWRKWTGSYNKDEGILRLEDYYDYTAHFDCSLERPPEPS